MSMSIVVRGTATPAAPPDRSLNAQVAEAERAGIATVARIQAAAYAGSVGMQCASMLSRAADEAFKTSPMGENVYRAIFLAFGNVATTEIQALSMQPRGE